MPDPTPTADDLTARVIARLKVWIAASLAGAFVPLVYAVAALVNQGDDLQKLKDRDREIRAEFGALSARVEVMTEMYYRFDRARVQHTRPDPILDDPDLKEVMP